MNKLLILTLTLTMAIAASNRSTNPEFLSKGNDMLIESAEPEVQGIMTSGEFLDMMADPLNTTEK